ncbi:NB-ARC domain-containing protein [Sorangium sp. So ce260]|uniref:beta-propeller domain-containing protein n=1 Tax=Sorangium sp. So ce260 TaxID=3133291 RepID=UPI003F63D814
MATILFLAADPVGATRLALGREAREIAHRLRAAPRGGALEVKQEWAVRVGDLQACLLRHQAHLRVIHFSGQGSSAGQLLVEDDVGGAVPLDREALARLFALLAGHVRCVVLSACFSLDQARAIAQHVDCVVGLEAALENEARIVWSSAFYQALGFGESVEKAAALGGNALELHGLAGAAPRLVVRERVKASAVYVGALGSPFLVPFTRNPGFVGRADDLVNLHALLQKGEAVGVRPAMLTGMGGIGKTQLAVEYVHAQREAYPDGIYWVNAAASWEDEFARLAVDVGCGVGDAPESERRRRLTVAFAAYLRERPEALVVFDNVEDPRTLRTADAGFIPVELGCRLLFTTRRRDAGKHFTSLEVGVLPREAAMALLLAERAACGPGELDAARMICRRLGHLPLALVLASAFLGQHPQIALHDYLDRLAEEGCLPAVDDNGVEALDLATQHTAAVGATLRFQWQALESEPARRVLQAAALLGEAEQVPRARLSLLTGLRDRAEKGRASPLGEALRAASQLWLVEELTDEEVRIHPLVREFIESTIADRSGFAAACAMRMGEALWDMGRLHEEVAGRGIDAVLTDLRAGAALAPEQRLVRLIRPLDLEAHNLRSWGPTQEPGFFLQQLRNCCLNLGEGDVQALAEARLRQANWLWLRERIPTRHMLAALVRTLEGHTADVYDVAVTAEGRFIISASSDTTLKVWDLATGQAIRTLKGHTDGVSSVAVTLDGRFAVSASWDRTLKVWDLAAEQAICTLKGHSGRVTSVAVTANGQLAISASWDKTIKVWDIAAGQVVHTLVGHRSNVTSITVTADGRFAVSASLDRTLIVWDVTTGEAIRTLTGHTPDITSVAVTADSRFAISASLNHTLTVWDIAAGQVSRTLHGHTGGVRDVAVTPNGRFAVSASEDKTIIVWDLASGQAVRTLQGHAAGVTGVTVTPDGGLAVSASEDRTIKIWNIASGEENRFHPRSGTYVSSVALTSDGRFAVSIRRASIRAWDAEERFDGFRRPNQNDSCDVWDIVAEQVIDTHEGYRRGLPEAVTADRRFAIYRPWKEETRKTLNVWDLAARRVICTLAAHRPDVYCLAVTADGRFAVSMSGWWRDQATTVWDLTTGRAIQSLQGSPSDMVGVAVTADCGFAVTASKCGIQVWDLTTGQAIRRIDRDRAALAANGRLAVTTSKHDLEVWDLATGQTIRTLQGHISLVNGAAVTEDGRFAVSASDDRTIKVWDLATGKALSTRATEVPLECCALTNDAKTIVVGDAAGTVHFIDWVKP